MGKLGGGGGKGDKGKGDKGKGEDGAAKVIKKAPSAPRGPRGTKQDEAAQRAALEFVLRCA